MIEHDCCLFACSDKCVCAQVEPMRTHTTANTSSATMNAFVKHRQGVASRGNTAGELGDDFSAGMKQAGCKDSSKHSVGVPRRAPGSCLGNGRVPWRRCTFSSV